MKMHCGIKVFLLLVFSSMISVVQPTKARAQSLNGQWKQELSASLEQFIKCQSPAESHSSCINFLGESLKKVYNLNDFYSTSMKRYLKPSEISEYLKENNKWVQLGRSFDQNVLASAQESANAKKAVVAVYMDAAGLGHVVLIVPGSLTPSGSWGLKVPNAASFFVSDPQKSFVDKGLSFAFTKNMMKDVVLYVRNY